MLVADFRDKHILDTSAWNALYDDCEKEIVIEAAFGKTILPTCVAIIEVAAIENNIRRIDILRLMKRLGRDNRPIATPNQLIVMACEGYSKRASVLNITGGADAEGAWIALNKPELVNNVVQQTALKFNAEREAVFRDFNEGLRCNLQPLFKDGTDRPRSMGVLIRHYARSDEFLYEVVNPIYRRATGTALPHGELHPLLNSIYIWPMFLIGYGCAIYQRAVQPQGYSHNKNPGHLDLWSAVYLPFCEVFVTEDKRQRRTLKVLNKANPRPGRIISYAEMRASLLAGFS
jgi:hypothetical protein